MNKSQRGLLVRHLSEEELDQAIESAPWTPTEIHALIKDRYNVTYHPAHLSRKLRESGMNYAKPRPVDPRRPDDAEEILAEEPDEEEEDPVVFGFF